MNGFWRFARQLLDEKPTLIAAMVFALISAGGLGAGLVALGPILSMMFEEGEQSLRTIAEKHNAEATGMDVTIPQWVIEQLPRDAFLGICLLIGGLMLLTVVGAFANFARLLPEASKGGRLLVAHDGAHRREVTAGVRAAVETVGFGKGVVAHGRRCSTQGSGRRGG